MTRHQKRLSVPKSWPVERKTATFTVKAGAGPHGEAGVPLVILLRDVLGYVDSKKEARYALSEDAILVNGTPINDEQRPIGMFDIVAFPARDEYYRVFPDEGGRLALTAIDGDAAESRLGKVAGKRQVSGGITQLTLHDGTNVIVDSLEYNRNDSIVIDNETNDIVAHFPYEEGALVTAVSGNHGGKIGTLEEIEVTLGSGSNIVTVSTDEETFETVEEYVVVIDENFTEDDDGGVSESEDVSTSLESDESDESDDPATDESAEESDDGDAESAADDESEGADTDEDEDEDEDEDVESVADTGDDADVASDAADTDAGGEDE